MLLFQLGMCVLFTLGVIDALNDDPFIQRSLVLLVCSLVGLFLNLYFWSKVRVRRGR